MLYKVLLRVILLIYTNSSHSSIEGTITSMNTFPFSASSNCYCIR